MYVVLVSQHAVCLQKQLINDFMKMYILAIINLYHHRLAT